MASTIPSLFSSNLITKSTFVTFSTRIKPGSKPAIILRRFRWLCSTSPPEYSPKTPPEFPEPGQGKKTIIPSVPEIEPGSTPNEIVHIRPVEIGPPQPETVPLPTPGRDSPVPPLDPPSGPDALPPPMGPDIMPPADRRPPDMPQVPPWETDPPMGPDIFPPPDGMPPGPGSWPEDLDPTLVF